MCLESGDSSGLNSTANLKGDQGGLRLDFVDFDPGVPPCHPCPIFTCPSRIGQTEEQTKSNYTRRSVVSNQHGHRVE